MEAGCQPQTKGTRFRFHSELVWLLRVGPGEQHSLRVGHGKSGLQTGALKKTTASAGNPKRAKRHAVFCDRPLQRPNYFTGRLLTAADLTSEQEYHRRMHRYHNLHLHGVGVVHGLKVSV